MVRRYSSSSSSSSTPAPLSSYSQQIRRVSGHFRSGIETMIREAELEEMEQKWREQNATIMAEHPPADMGLVHEAPVAVAPPLESDTDNKPAPSLSKPAPKRKPRKPNAAS